MPVEVQTGLEGSRNFTLPDFKTIGTFCKSHKPDTFTLGKYSWYSFLLEAESTPGHSVVGKIKSMKNSNDTIDNRTRDLPACNIKELLHRVPPLIRSSV